MAPAAQPRLLSDRRQRGLHPRQGRRRAPQGLTIRVRIRVKPGSGRNRVAGRYGDDALVVAVTQPAVDGRATEAALRALAGALGVAVRDVTLVSGATSRTKVIDIPDPLADRFEALLDA